LFAEADFAGALDQYRKARNCTSARFNYREESLAKEILCASYLAQYGTANNLVEEYVRDYGRKGVWYKDIMKVKQALR
jgi:hypothetical protein